MINALVGGVQELSIVFTAQTVQTLAQKLEPTTNRLRRRPVGFKGNEATQDPSDHQGSCLPLRVMAVRL